mmetsp:Transcript_95740/g.249430  ORF Transcript_95740/g.249430 Transcript_95740/m.249430 type:complete len:227 (+) Transcript_95740:140-820(+)
MREPQKQGQGFSESPKVCELGQRSPARRISARRPQAHVEAMGRRPPRPALVQGTERVARRVPPTPHIWASVCSGLNAGGAAKALLVPSGAAGAERAGCAGAAASPPTGSGGSWSQRPLGGGVLAPLALELQLRGELPLALPSVSAHVLSALSDGNEEVATRLSCLCSGRAALAPGGSSSRLGCGGRSPKASCQDTSPSSLRDSGARVPSPGSGRHGCFGCCSCGCP